MRIKVGLVRYDTKLRQRDDIPARLARVELALIELQGAIDREHWGAQRLQGILLAPEYMFANVILEAGDHDIGHRRQLEMQQRDDILRRLVVLSVRHPRILLVPGTIAWREPKNPDHANRYVRNLAFAVKFPVTAELNGDNLDQPTMKPSESKPLWDPLVRTHRQKQQDLQAAEFVSRNSAYGFFEGRCVCKYHKVADYYEVLHRTPGGAIDTVQIPSGKPGRFDVSGLSFGISICYDQGLEQGGLKPLQKLAQPVDIHILLSAYVTADLELTHLAPGRSWLLSCASEETRNEVANIGMLFDFLTPRQAPAKSEVMFTQDIDTRDPPGWAVAVPIPPPLPG